MINREQTHKEESILKGSPRERAGDFCMRATCNNGFFFVINDVAIGFIYFLLTKRTLVHTHQRELARTFHLHTVPQRRVLPRRSHSPARTASKRSVMRGGSKQPVTNLTDRPRKMQIAQPTERKQQLRELSPGILICDEVTSKRPKRPGG